NRVRIRYQGSYRRALIADGRHAEIKEPGQKIGPVYVRVQFEQAGDDAASGSVDITTAVGPKPAGRSDSLNASLLDQNVARTCYWCTGSIDDSYVPDQRRPGYGRGVRDWPTDFFLLAVWRAQAQASI